MITIEELEKKFADYERRINRLKQIQSHVFHFGYHLVAKKDFAPVKNTDEIEELRTLIKEPLSLERAEELYSTLKEKIQWEKMNNLEKARKLLKDKKYDDAIVFAKMELETENEIEAALLIAEAEKRKGMPEVGAETLIKLLKDKEINKDTEEAFYTAASLYEDAGEKEKALALRENIQWRKMNNLEKARKLLKDKKYDESIEFAKKELNTKNEIEAALLIVEAEKKKGMPEVGAEILTKVLKNKKIDKNTEEAFYTLARLYEDIGEEERALEIYKRFLAEFIKYKDIEERYNKLKKTTPKKKVTPISEKPVGTGTLSVADIGLSKEAQERYVLVREIGKGGMGVVYEAKDTLLDRQVALKVMRPEISIRRRERERFLKEARTSARLNHPNIVTLYDIVEDESGQIFLVFEYVDGRNLSHLIDNEKISLNESIDIGTQVLEGLKYAHTKGVIHRDLKPSNIMITKRGRAKILDFGIARVAYNTLYTFTGQTSGTPAYMAPEQHLGEKVDQRCDIYSFGATLYEMLTGELPFKGADLLVAKREKKIIPPTEINPKIPKYIEEIILQCLEPDKENRPKNAEELIKRLKKG